MRALARALLKDEHAAEDVVQDAWIQTLQSGPRDPGASRAWFETIVRRLAVNRLRGGHRRRDRELSAVRPGHVPSSAEIAAELEAHRSVLDAIESLGEPHRSVLRDRYLGDLTPAELARRDKSSVDAVKSRLARARRELRARLDHIESKRGGSWQGALLPMLGGIPQAGSGALSGATSYAASMTGILAMKKLALAASIIAVAFMGWKMSTTSPQGPTGGTETASTDGALGGAPSKGAQEDQTVGSTVLVAPDGSQGAASARTDAGGEEPWSIKGSVFMLKTHGGELLHPGQPVEVTLAIYEVKDPGDPTSLTREIQKKQFSTNDEGQFEWIPSPFEGVHALSFTASLDGYSCIPASPILVSAGEPAESLSLILQGHQGELVGTVRDVDGEPVAGATVRWDGGETETDARGEYSAEMGRQFPYQVIAIADGHGMAKKRLQSRQVGGTLRVDLALSSELQIKGLVKDEAGRPIPGADVRTFYYKELAVKTDAAGRYVMAHVPRELRDGVQVFARSDGLCEAKASSPIPLEGDLTVDLVLERGAEVRGAVTDPKGQPLAGVELFIGFSQFAYGRLDATSDAEGAFVFPVVPAGPQTLWVLDDRYAPFRHDFEVVVGAANVPDINVSLSAGRTIQGVARNPAGEPLEGIRVIGQRNHEYFGSGARTNVNGEFEIKAVPDGAFELEAYGGDYLRTNTPFDADHEGPFDIVLERSGWIQGRVVDAETGKPVDRFTVRFVKPDLREGESRLSGYPATWSREGHDFTAGDGTWSTGQEDLETGTIIGLQVHAAGYAPIVIRRAIVTPRTTDEPVIARLFPPVDLNVRVLRGDSRAPASGMVVTVNQVEHRGELDLIWTGKTDESGEVLIEDAPQGQVFVVVGVDERVQRRLGPFDVEGQSGRAEIEVLLRDGTLVRGSVLDSAAGRPVPGATLRLSPLRVANATSAVVQSTADAQGAFEFHDVPPGRYRLARLDHDGVNDYAALSLTFDVTDRTEHLDIDLAPPVGGAGLTGSVAGAAEATGPIRVRVRSTNELGADWTVLASDGAFELSGIPAGTYAVSAILVSNIGRRAGAEVEVQLSEGMNRRVELALK